MGCQFQSAKDCRSGRAGGWVKPIPRALNLTKETVGTAGKVSRFCGVANPPTRVKPVNLLGSNEQGTILFLILPLLFLLLFLVL
jgi:hypothetical protein